MGAILFQLGVGIGMPEGTQTHDDIQKKNIIKGILFSFDNEHNLLYSISQSMESTIVEET